MHKYIFEKIKTLRKPYSDYVLKRKDVRIMIARHKVPLKLHTIFLKELESFGWIKFHNRYKIELNKEIDFPFKKVDDELDIQIIQ